MTQDIFEPAPSVRQKWLFAARYARVSIESRRFNLGPRDEALRRSHPLGLSKGQSSRVTSLHARNCQRISVDRRTTREGFRPTRRTLGHPSSVFAPFNQSRSNYRHVLLGQPRLNAINVIFFVARPICAFGAEADGLMSYSADFGRPSRVRNLLFEDPFTTYSADHRSNYCRM